MAIKLSSTFLLRKLHQLTGIVPLGIFFLIHMFTNSKAVNGEASFEKAVKDIHEIPYLLFLEVFGIFIPLLFHSIYGVIITAEAKPNVSNYNYSHNWFYMVQRVTGVYLFVFLLFHVLNLRFGLIPGLNLTPVAGNANLAYDIVSAEFSIPWVMIVYLLGIAATSWHLAYGIWLFAVDWGFVIGEKAQKFAFYGCAAAALVLFAIGANAAIAFVRPCGLLPSIMCEQPASAMAAAPAKA